MHTVSTLGVGIGRPVPTGGGHHTRRMQMSADSQYTRKEIAPMPTPDGTAVRVRSAVSTPEPEEAVRTTPNRIYTCLMHTPCARGVMGHGGGERLEQERTWTYISSRQI